MSQDMKLYQQVFENNRKWVEDKLNQDKDFFVKLAKDQRPDFLYIGCSDSRIPANEVMGLDPGDVFVHRNIANLVVNTDMNVKAVIKYAIDYLDVKHIIVCGHYGCGGVKAAMEQKDYGTLNGWLREVRDVYRFHKQELNSIENLEQRYDRLVELNVREQATNVIKTATLQSSYIKRGFPTVHGWVYDLKSGLLKDLGLDFKAILKDIQEIYNLNEG